MGRCMERHRYPSKALLSGIMARTAASGSARAGRAVIVLSTTVPVTLRFLSGQARRLREEGFEVVLLSSPGRELDSMAAREGASVVAVPMKRRPSPISDVCALVRQIIAFRRLRPSIVSASTPKAGLLGMIAAAYIGVPVRHYLVRGLPLATAPIWQRPVLWSMEFVACRIAHQVQCVSHSLRDDIVRRGLAKPDKCVVLCHGSSNGVDAEVRFNPSRFSVHQREEVRREFGVPPDCLLVGFVGRLCKDKGVLELLAAWEHVSRRRPRAHLLILGPLDGSEPILSRRLEQLRSSGRATVLTEFREPDDCYLAMDLMVLPSHREGFPNVVLEASATSLPVVTTDAVGCRDSVIDGVTGRVVAVGDVAALVGALEEYIDSPATRSTHGAAGRARVLKEFRPDDIVKAQVALFQALLATRGRETGPTS
jgi:glycosyltransferase involved in cell wall biosynthesis